MQASLLSVRLGQHARAACYHSAPGVDCMKFAPVQSQTTVVMASEPCNATVLWAQPWSDLILFMSQLKNRLTCEPCGADVT